MHFPIPFRFAALLTLLFRLATTASAQSTWSLVNATSLGGDCYQLTKSKDHEKGAAWSTTMLNLKKPFDLYFRLNFGSNDNGADGIAIVLQKSPAGLNAIDDEGCYMGYSSSSPVISPAVDIEFDTYANSTGFPFFDLVDDHSAIYGDGLEAPPWVLSNAVSLGMNVEDGAYHSVQVSWRPSGNSLTVYFDCNLIHSLVYDLKGGVFNGDSLVYYGLTAGTGSNHNLQTFCELYLNAGNDTTHCPGNAVMLEGNSNFTSYSWSPASGLSCTTCLNPLSDPNSNTDYVLTGTLGCLTASDTVNVNVDCLILPIELTSFAASCGKNQVELKWVTASEYNNDYFSVERSPDALHYQTIGRVDGAGNSSESHSYSFADKQLLPGSGYYRLKQVDFEGTSTYSNVQSLTCASPLGFLVYPNPSQNETHLRIQSSVRSSVTCMVVDMSGKIVFRQEIKLSEGINELLLGNNQLPKGIYDVALISCDKVLHSLLVIQ